ncbi:MAG: glycogen synthase [Candidatus Limnocylindrales bacterium]
MHIAMVASECEPFAKTGGLADVVDALARALGRLGHEVDVYLPRYRGIRVPDGVERLRRTLAVPFPITPRRLGSVKVNLLTVPVDGYRVRLVDYKPAFDRGGLYGEGGRDYPDNAGRFALLGRTALEAIRADGAAVDIIHGHDWQAGPVLLLLRHRYGGDAVLGRAATVLTCHNLAYHGWTGHADAWRLGVPGAVGSADGVDLLREGLGHVDLVNTVSPTYAEETRGPAYGAGVDDLLDGLGDRYLGIMNGIDTDLWDPAHDPVQAAPFSLADPAGKARCKADLLRRHGLAGRADRRWDARGAPLMGLIGRLDPQKGFDLLAGAAPALLRMGVRLVVLGTGDARLVADLQALAAKRPDRLVVLDRFDRDEARRIYAASDAFLMPSRFEPSGQGQLIALRYGSLPIVRATGGLADSVFDADTDPATGNGFTFGPAEPAALEDAVRRAVAAYRDAPRWAALVRRGMAEDHSWAVPAARYVAAYAQAGEVHAARR